MEDREVELNSAGTELTESLRAAMARSDEIWKELRSFPERFRVLTGERTTGPMHIGHYFGSLKSRVTLQDGGVDVFLVLADYQAITDRDANAELPDIVHGIVLDYLGIGLDPERCTMFVHSMIPSLNQLMLPFLSVVSMAELRRNPTVKEEIGYSGGRTVSGLMMTYPVHQAADILFCHGNLVPGGRDQLPHIEVTRLIARRINSLYFEARSYFPEPDLLIGDTPMLGGLDGRKMGKSLNNSIQIRHTEDETAALIRRAVTDPERVITYEPARRPEVANLLDMAALTSGEAPEVIAESVGAGGAAVLKRVVTDSVNDYFREIRRRRREYEADPGYVRRVLREGTERAAAIADQTLEDLREGMRMRYY